MDENESYSHLGFTHRSCLICSSGSGVFEVLTKPFSRPLEKNGFSKSFSAEGFPVKYFVGWIIKNLPLNLQKVIFEFKCPECRKSFREYLVTGPIDCFLCPSNFAPIIRGIREWMIKKEWEFSGEEGFS